MPDRRPGRLKSGAGTIPSAKAKENIAAAAGATIMPRSAVRRREQKTRKAFFDKLFNNLALEE
jgi:hypothetical protein